MVVSRPYAYCPLTICTTHQLLRFKAAFDLIVVDEVDAFHWRLVQCWRPSNAQKQGVICY